MTPDITNEEFLAMMTRSKLKGLAQNQYGDGGLVEISLSTGDGRYITRRFTQAQINEEYARRPEPEKQPIRGR